MFLVFMRLKTHVEAKGNVCIVSGAFQRPTVRGLVMVSCCLCFRRRAVRERVMYFVFSCFPRQTLKRKVMCYLLLILPNTNVDGRGNVFLDVHASQGKR